jgi:hypothetical protein
MQQRRRAIGMIRLSILTDETASPERQRADIQAKADARGQRSSAGQRIWT